MLAALAARAVTESIARALCGWTDKLPEASRDAADEILLAAAGAGMGLRDLAELAGEMYQRSRRTGPMRTRPAGSRTGPCGWRPPSRARGSPPGT